MKLDQLFRAVPALCLAIPMVAAEETPEIPLKGATVFGYLDLDNDFQRFGDLVNLAYREFLIMQPDVPPFPVDANVLLRQLGLASIKGLTIASHPMEHGYFLNRSLLHLPENEVRGLLNIAGNRKSPFIGETLFNDGVDMVVEFHLNANALLETIRELAMTVGGPMMVGMVDMQLQGEFGGHTLRELIGMLDTRVIVGLHYEDRASLEYREDVDAFVSQVNVPGFTLVLSGAGSLFETVQQMIPAEGMEVIREDGIDWMLNPIPGLGDSFSLALGNHTGTGDLLLSSGPGAWRAMTSGTRRLSDDADFQRLRSAMPEAAAQYYYSSERFHLAQFDGLDLRFLGGWQSVVEQLLDEMRPLLRSALGMTWGTPDGIYTVSLAPYSHKHQVFVSLIGMGVGALQMVPSAGDMMPSAEEDPVDGDH